MVQRNRSSIKPHTMPKPKKLIEVALPIKEISAESVRDKSIRHGHISTLHLWWARRPLPVCRAVVFASLVPDPLDEHCPPAFVDAVQRLLGKDPHTRQDPYQPYDDIPYTAAIDPMADNPRNRLLMFIGKFSDEFIRKGGKAAAKAQLQDGCLIKWESKNDEGILNLARKLIWVAHNAATGKDAPTLLQEFEHAYRAIKQAESALYRIPDRHIRTEEVIAREQALEQAREHFLDHMPKVFDPFAGGGAIPLEASRLGCRSYGNDINPVAHIIQKGSLEFPQKYGKPITYSREEFVRRYGEEELEKQRLAGAVFGDQVAISNRLSFDVEFYARQLIARTETEVGHLYPADEHGNQPIAYYWARVGTCSNPSCRAEVPLLKGFYLCNKPDKKVYLKPIIKGKDIEFEVKSGSFEMERWVQKSSLNCPVCGNATEQKEITRQLHPNEVKSRLLAVIEEGANGKEYRLPTETEIQIVGSLTPKEDQISEKLPAALTGGSIMSWGYSIIW
jgi:putative DNA methylase